MNRRGFIARAAIATGAVLNGVALQAKAASNQASEPKSLVEWDISRGGWRELPLSVDLFVRLDEPDPGDPGQLSGVQLRIVEGGRCCTVLADFEVCQPNGDNTSHCLGYLRSNPAPMASFLLQGLDAGDSFACQLGDLYYEGTSPMHLFYSEREQEFRVMCAHHAFGVLRGRLLDEFREALRWRLACEVK